MSAKQVIAIGCGLVLVVVLAVVGVVVLLVAHVAQDPKDMRLAIEVPATIKRGEKFKLVIEVVNDRTDKPMDIGSIDIGEEYLKGFNVLGSEPAYSTSATVPFDDSRSYEFKHQIPPGATNQFSFKLQARKTGRYFGEVDVCEGMRFLTMVVETQVE